MTTKYIHVNGIQNLRGALERGQRQIRKDVDKAIWSTAKKAERPIRRRAPKAFGELANSVQAYQRGSNGNPVTSVDAPHAGAVEIGSPPHKPDFERLLAWVKLRGLQGRGVGFSRRTGRGLRKRFPKAWGPTTPFHARNVGSQLKALAAQNIHGDRAAIKVAQAISKGIELHGTRPHWFVRESLGDIREILNSEIHKVLKG